MCTAPGGWPELQREQRDRITMNHLIMVPRCTSHKIMFNRARTRESRVKLQSFAASARNCRSAAWRNWRDVARRIFTHRGARNCIALQPLFLRPDLYARACVRTFQRQNKREREILITQVLRRSASPFFIKVRAGTKQTNKHTEQTASH